MAISVYVRRICATTGLVIFLAVSLGCSGGHAAEPKRVLVLHSFGREFKPWSEYAKAIRTELDRQSPWPLDIIEFSLVAARTADANSEAPFVDYLHALFAKRPPDLIVSIGAPAAVFVQQHRPQLFTTTPMVIAALEQRRIQRSSLTENDTVVAVAADFPAIIENILRVLPETKTVAVVMGDSPNERFWLKELRKEFPPFADRLSFIWYNDRSFADILKHVAALPPHSAIFFFLMNIDAAGVVYEGDTALQRLSAVANAPIFTHDSAYFGRKIVGGPMHSVSNLGRLTADAAVRILAGEKASDVRIPASTFAAPIFDWREMQRWGISEKNLPPGSEILFRNPPAWEQYRWQIAFIFSVIFMQAALIAGLLYEHRRRRLAEGESFRRMAELAHLNRIATAGELSASIAHEVKQPLAAMVAHSGAARHWLAGETPNLQEVLASLKKIEFAGQRAGEIVENLRSMFRKETNGRRPLDINRLVRNVLAITGHEIEKNSISVKTSLSSEVEPLVLGDQAQLEQVLLNLVVNAIEAMSSSNGNPRVLELKTAPKTGNEILVSVADTGPGIEAENLEKMFNAYYTTKAHGMGMGLSICRSIIESHGGRLWVSQGDRGLTFYVSLPRGNRWPGWVNRGPS